MSSEESVTHWFKEFHNGDDSAVTRLWDYYFERLVKLARRKLGVTPRRTFDEEDIALSAFKSLFNGVRKGGISDDLDRDHLWKLMTTITLRKVYDYIKHGQRQKRMPRTGSGVHPVPLDCQAAIEMVISREPDPEICVQVEEEFQLLLDCLVHKDLQQIAVLKIEGYTNQEIARQMERGLSTVERKLRTIRELWQWKFDH